MSEIYYLIYGFIMGAALVSMFKGDRTHPEIEKKCWEIWKKREQMTKLPEKCPRCGGDIKHIEAGTSKRTGQPYREFWACENPDCSFSVNKKRGQYIWSWDNTPPSKGRTSDKTKTPKSQGDKKEEVRETDEIDVSQLQF